MLVLGCDTAWDDIWTAKSWQWPTQTCNQKLRVKRRHQKECRTTFKHVKKSQQWLSCDQKHSFLGRKIPKIVIFDENWQLKFKKWSPQMKWDISKIVVESRKRIVKSGQKRTSRSQLVSAWPATWPTQCKMAKASRWILKNWFLCDIQKHLAVEFFVVVTQWERTIAENIFSALKPCFLSKWVRVKVTHRSHHRWNGHLC